jgi:hypothetical protein
MTCRILCGVVAAVLMSAAPPDARACGYHGILGDGFSAQYPGSINVAIALREAADEGLIDAQSLKQRSADLLAYHRAVRRLQHLRDAFVQSEAGHKLTFSLLLVESGLWSRYASDGQDVSLAVHIDRPQDGEAVVMTGEAVLVAIEAGTLSWRDALQRKLLMVMPSGTGEVPRVPTL